MSEDETFAADSISTGSPVLGVPVFVQDHIIQPDSITTGAPIVPSFYINPSEKRVVSITSNSNNIVTLSYNYNKAA
jgi:hypothetical protein